MWSSVVVAQAAALRLIARKPLQEGTMRLGEPKHMTWVEDATKYEDKQCLQRDVTEVTSMSRGGVREEHA